jgi:hypothetical protein
MKKVKEPALILLLILIPLTSFAAEKGDFNHLVPQYNPEKKQVIYKGEIYKFDQCWLRDKDDDGVKETTLCRFLHPEDSNKRVVRYTIKDINWAWGIMENYKDRNDIVSNFLIADTDGDGKFDTKYAGNEGFSLPDWLKNGRRK